MTPVFLILLVYALLLTGMSYYSLRLSKVSIQVGSDLTVLRMWICDGAGDDREIGEALRYSLKIGEEVTYLRDEYVLNRCPSVNGKGVLKDALPVH